MTAESETELVNEVKEFLTTHERSLEILLEILIKVKSTESNNKVSNEQTIEVAELVRIHYILR